MKIGVEASVLMVKQKTGVQQYCQNLFAALTRLNPDDTYYLMHLGSKRTSLPSLITDRPNVIEHKNAWLPRKLYNAMLRTPFAPPIDLITRTGADLYLFPNFVRWPLLPGKRSIVFVYDTSYLDYPEATASRHHQMYLRWAVPRSVKRADHVVVDSEHVKESLIRHYSLPQQKITVITPGINHDEFKPATTTAIDTMRERFGIKHNYILYLGTLEPRKNITGIIRAYMALSPELRSDYQLVLAGGKGWRDEAIEKELQGVPKENLVLTGYVPDELRSTLYSGAAVFIYPSFMEGWGMPVVEAMACGAPVITADNSSLPEAGGEAAVYAKTGDQEDLNTQLATLLKSPDQRQRRRGLGIKHASGFTWDGSAKRLKSLIDLISR